MKPADKPQQASPLVSCSWFAMAAMPRFAVPILLAAGLLTFVANLGGYPFYTKGEAREALAVLDMIQHRHLILPRRAGVELAAKPPLMYWLAAALSVAFGKVGEWPMRLPSALLAITGIELCYFYVRRLFADEVGLLSAIILATSVQYIQASTGARVDMTLTFFMEVAFFEFILLAEGMSRRWPVLYLAIALAVLAKGPVGLVLPAGTALIWVALERRWNLLRALHLWWGAVLILAIDGGWYLAASWSAGTAFIQKQILAENLFRFFPSAAFHEGHVHSFLYVEGALIAGFMPWSLIVPAAAFRFFKSRDRSRSPRLSYLAVWFLTVLVFYNLARSKRGVYLLALYPALATMAGTWFCDVQSLRGHINRWVRASSRAVGIFFVAAGLSALLALWALFYSPETFHDALQGLGIKASGFVPALQHSVKRYPSTAAVVSLAAVAIGIFLSTLGETIQSIFAGVGAGVSIIALGANLVVIPAIADTLSLKPFSAAIGHAVGEESVGFLGGIIYEVAFYSGVPIQVIKLGNRPLPRFLVCWKPVYLAMAPEMRRHFVPVAESGPTALDGSGGVLLLKSLWAEVS